MMHCQIQIELPSEAQTVSLCRRTAQALLADLAIDEERAADITMVLSEAAGNVVRHAYPHPHHLYRVTLSFHSDRVRLEVADAGRGFVHSAARPPDAEQLGGRGLWLIEQLADAITVSTLPDGGCVLQAEFLLPHPLLRHPPIHDAADRGSPEGGAAVFEELAGPYLA
jgi:anti-sigma regulatory factor (Ser/Thr protein kinase)